ncbi:MAG: WD40 repeat domain-containing protein [Symbiobacteriia bacterium]
MSHRVLRMRLGALVTAVMVAASLLAGCGQGDSTGSESSPAQVARVFVEKFGWHPQGAPAVSQTTVPAIEPASHHDVSNELLRDAGVGSLASRTGQSVETYNFHLNDQREGNLKGLPLHAFVWVREGQVVGAWIFPQGDTGDPARDNYAGGFYSIKGRTLEEVTGQDFQLWRESRLAEKGHGSGASPSQDDINLPPEGSLASPVTWTISSLDAPWMKGPISVRLMLPQRFRLAFSTPVDRPTVEQALRRDLESAYSTEGTWKDDQTFDFTIKSGPATERSTFLRLSVAGGKDKNGLTLQATNTLRGPAEFQLGVGTASEVWRWTLGDKPRLVTALPGPFDVLSVSPDGTKLVLRLYGIESSAGWPPVGPPSGFAYLYDMATEKLTRLQGVSGWLSPQWLADGSLVIGSTNLLGLMRVAPDGVQTALVKNLEVVDYAVTPDGHQVAVFVVRGGEFDAKGDLWLIDLPSGKRHEFNGVYTPARTPNGVPYVEALWSPDGTSLAFGDRTGFLSLEGTYRVVEFSAATGKLRTLLPEGGGPRAWSPDGKYLFVAAAGILDVTRGKVVLPKSPDRFTFNAQFSPRGDWVYVDGLGLLEVPSWRLIDKVRAGYRGISWSPDGDLVGLTNSYSAESYSDLGWGVQRADGTEIWSRQGLFPDALIGTHLTWGFLWSPEGRFVAIPGVGVGDTRDGQMHLLQSDLGSPIGWNRSGALFLSPNTNVVDREYVKPTQFGR